MRHRATRVLTLVSFGLGLGILACERETKPQGELVLALQSDLKLPEDVSRVVLQVKVDGVVKLSNSYDVGPDGVRIPATLALVDRENSAAAVSIRVVALQGDKPRVLRDVVTTVPPNRAALLRLPIQWLCADGASLRAQPPLVADESPDVVTTSCPTLAQTCVAGGCVDAFVDSASLPDFAEPEVFGGGTKEGGGACFDVSGCFAAPVGAALDADCSLPAPPDVSMLNVAVRLPPTSDGVCGPSGCFIVLDAGSPSGYRVENGRVRLPESVCRRKLDVAVSVACTAKTERVPTCGPWSSVSAPAPAPVADAGGPPPDGGQQPIGDLVYGEPLAVAGTAFTAVAVSPSPATLYFAKSSTTTATIYRCPAASCTTPEVLATVPEPVTALAVAADRLVYRRGVGSSQTVVDCAPAGGSCAASAPVFPMATFDSIAAATGKTFALSPGPTPGIFGCLNGDPGASGAKCSSDVPTAMVDVTARSIAATSSDLFWLDGLSNGRILRCGGNCAAPSEMKSGLGADAHQLSVTPNGQVLAWLGPSQDGGKDFSLWDCAISNCGGRPILASGVRGYVIGDTRVVVVGEEPGTNTPALARLDLQPGSQPQILRTFTADPTALAWDEPGRTVYYAVAEGGRIELRRYLLP